MEHQESDRDTWLKARKQLLARERELTRLRDELSAQRRDLPWVRVHKSYTFESANGKVSLGDLFAGRGQLIVYHFMFAPEWEAGCKSCSFWADGFGGSIAHLAQRDVSFVAISRAPLAKLQAFAARLGWGFEWVSSGGSDFNYDFQVSFDLSDVDRGEATYNFGPLRHRSTDMPGFSVFARDDQGAVFHTYSCFARGIDMLNPTYQLLDLVPKGRDEAKLPAPMSWVKLHDQYAR